MRPTLRPSRLKVSGLGAAAGAGAYVERIPRERFNHGGTRNLGISRARQVTDGDEPQLLNVVRELSLAANLPEFDEPTLGTIVGDDFYFVANSHWNRFDANNELPGGLTGPIVLKLSLRGGGADDAI